MNFLNAGKFVKAAGLSGMAVMLFASLASGQNTWTVISTVGNPDTITTFDLAAPGTSQSQIGLVDGNFTRGMDYFSSNSFYYFVSTDALNDPGDRGLWSWESGVNTQLATIGFNDFGDGDATYDLNSNRFFVIVDDQDTVDGDSLYVWDSLNGTPTFTEIGETGLTQFMGLAIDPTDGTLFGFDAFTKGLYTIDIFTGMATLVGSSGGIFAGVGGMDFSADGSTLLLSSGDDLFLVDKTTGQLTEAGILTGLITTSALAYNVVAVPEPSGLVMLALCGLACSRRRKR